MDDKELGAKMFMLAMSISLSTAGIEKQNIEFMCGMGIRTYHTHKKMLEDEVLRREEQLESKKERFKGGEK